MVLRVIFGFLFGRAIIKILFIIIPILIVALFFLWPYIGPTVLEIVSQLAQGYI